MGAVRTLLICVLLCTGSCWPGGEIHQHAERADEDTSTEVSPTEDSMKRAIVFLRSIFERDAKEVQLENDEVEAEASVGYLKLIQHRHNIAEVFQPWKTYDDSQTGENLSHTDDSVASISRTGGSDGHIVSSNLTANGIEYTANGNGGASRNRTDENNDLLASSDRTRMTASKMTNSSSHMVSGNVTDISNGMVNHTVGGNGTDEMDGHFGHMISSDGSVVSGNRTDRSGFNGTATGNRTIVVGTDEIDDMVSHYFNVTVDTSGTDDNNDHLDGHVVSSTWTNGVGDDLNMTDAVNVTDNNNNSPLFGHNNLAVSNSETSSGKWTDSSNEIVSGDFNGTTGAIGDGHIVSSNWTDNDGMVGYLNLTAGVNGTKNSNSQLFGHKKLMVSNNGPVSGNWTDNSNEMIGFYLNGTNDNNDHLDGHMVSSNWTDSDDAVGDYFNLTEGVNGTVGKDGHMTIGTGHNVRHKGTVSRNAIENSEGHMASSGINKTACSVLHRVSSDGNRTDGNMVHTASGNGTTRGDSTDGNDTHMFNSSGTSISNWTDSNGFNISNNGYLANSSSHTVEEKRDH
ncbi:autotransporter adhesin BpaC-like [Antennarius striatus]|uniref:autotransporter adhesin BpaC-like n=1 Tax=Antennarius striatus TaxID=241820 RepID=UPI0035B4E8A2